MGGHFQWINCDGGGRRDDDDNKKEDEDEETDDNCERMMGLYLSYTFFFQLHERNTSKDLGEIHFQSPYF